MHASHRLRLHRLPRAGDELTSTARVTAVAARRSGTLVVARLVTRDAGGGLVSETDYGSLYRGVSLAGPASEGAAGSDIAGAGAARHAPARRSPAPPRWTERVDVPYHLGPRLHRVRAHLESHPHRPRGGARGRSARPDPARHRHPGPRRRHGIVERDLGGDCRAVRGIEARFTGMVPLPSTFTVRAGARDLHGIAFEAVDAHGARVLSEGVLRL